MRRVLFLAYHFPPIGGGGVQRNSKFVRYLPEFGWAPLVVTGPGGARGRWTPDDATLAADVPAGVAVHRIQGPEPPVATRWRGRGERWLGLRSAWERWFVEGAVETGLAAATDGVDVVLASLEPYQASALAARELAARLGCPLVVDLQDPWALDEMRIYATDVHRRVEVRRMRAALTAADAVVMNTSEAAARVRRRFPALRDVPVPSIPNGFDAADFDRPPPRRDDDAFRIVHSGYLHTEVGTKHRRTRRIRRLIGGAVEPRVDLLTRSHVFLVEAIERVRRDHPALAARLELHLAGVLGDADLEVAHRSPATRLHGYLPHHDALDLVRGADLLFLPMQDLPPGVSAGLVPGKTYEYLASGRPILAAVPDGDARDLLGRAGTAFLCRPGDVGAMAEILTDLLRRREAGAAPPRLDDDCVGPYERRELTRALAGVLEDAVLRRGGAASGAGAPPRQRVPA